MIWILVGRFPAGVFLIEHESEGYMLLDTGVFAGYFPLWGAGVSV